MKHIALVLAFLLSAAGFSFAMPSPSYTASYTFSSIENSDGTFTATITTVIDGTTAGDCMQTQCTPIYQGVQCSQVPIPNCPGTHIPSVVSGFNGSSGTVTGPNFGMWDYMNWSSTQQLGGLQPNTDYLPTSKAEHCVSR